MLRVVAGQVWRRRGRTLAVVAAIVVVAVSFSLLTSAVATSRLQVKGTVEENFRSAYDILVRPPGSQTDLERSERLVRENYLSGIFGGITMRQYEQIKDIPGVQVAAPVAMVGYFFPTLNLPLKINTLVDERAAQQVYRVRKTWVSERGLSAHPEADMYIYVTKQPFNYDGGGQSFQREPVTGRRIDVCAELAEQIPAAGSAFDRRAEVGLSCFSTTTPTRDPFSLMDRDDIGYNLFYPVPVLLAAVDPEQEARLVGLDEAVVDGRYLRESDRQRLVLSRPETPRTSGKFKQVPVLMADRTVVDEQLRIDVQQLDTGSPRQVPGRLAGDGGLRWLEGLSGPTVRTTALDAADLYPELIAHYTRDKPYLIQTNYWSTSQVDYQRTPDGLLTPAPRRNEDAWPLGSFAPAANADVGFRDLTAHFGSNELVNGVFQSPILRSVGLFDPNQIRGFAPLSQVPLTTYNPPSATPGDARTAQLLGGQSLRPDNNLAGYLQQPPLLLTSLRAVSAFRNPNAYSGVDNTKGPISVIRVRVAGVSGPDPFSLERVRLAAERIVRETGLDVDITIGTSPTPQLIDLPAGEFGRPQLTLEEAWVKKGVAVTLLQAIDRKSLVLFALVLLVCVLFMFNATLAAVRSRRAELGVLATLGWPRRSIFALLELELLATGMVAGLIGTAAAAVLVTALDLRINTIQLVLITPIAVALASLSGLTPAWRASQATPLEAIRPPARAPRRTQRVGSVAALALIGVRRLPGRTAVGAAALFTGVAALAMLIAVQNAFHGRVVGTALGDAIAVDVRAVDYLAAALTIALGAFAVADIAYLNLTERTEEIGTLRASGWADRHVRRLFATEALFTAALGAVAGAAVGATIVAVLLHVPAVPALLGGGLAAATGMIAALLALLIPLARLSRIAPAAAMNHE